MLNSHEDSGKPKTTQTQTKKPTKTSKLDISSHSRHNYYSSQNSAKVQSKPISHSSDYYHISSHPKQNQNILEINEDVAIIPETHSHSKHSSSSDDEVIIENSGEVQSKTVSHISTGSNNQKAQPLQKESQSEQEALLEVPNSHASEVQSNPEEFDSDDSSDSEDDESDDSEENEQDETHQNQQELSESDEIETVPEQNPKSRTHENFIKLEDADSFDELFPENYVDLNSYFNGDKKTEKRNGFYNKW